MKLENLENGYIKVNMAREGNWDCASLDSVKMLECVLPFRVEKEENCLLYHVGTYISLAEYLNMKELSLEEAKGIFLSCIECFERIENCGGMTGNIISDVYYTYIDPVTMELRFLYCPLLVELHPDNLKELMKKLLLVMRTKDAEMLIGSIANIVANMPRREEEITIFRDCVLNLKDNIRIIEKKVEVERVVEKIIEKPIKQKSYIGKNITAFAAVYTGALIFLPILLEDVVGTELVSAPKLMNVLLCMVAILISTIYSIWSSKKTKDKVVVTMQPQEPQKEKADL